LTRTKTNINQSGNPAAVEPENLPTLDGISEAHGLLADDLKNTPLLHSEKISGFFDADVWIKNETVSPIASFKIRGALTDLIRRSRQKKLRGAVTSSTGNHGQGVAYAARLLDIPAHIFLPENPNPFKRDGIRSLGAAIHERGDDIDDAKQAARFFARGNGYEFVDDGESLNVIEGAGTIGLEIARALPRIDAVFIPMGSGSLACGAGASIKSLQPEAKIVAVQSEGAPAMVKSFCARAAIRHSINTIADGLVCREPAQLALRGLLAFVDEARLVGDRKLTESVSALAELENIFVETSGAAAFAAAWKRKREINGKRIVLILTGANSAGNAPRRAPEFPFPSPVYAGK
jgi:threonine dehydratase